MSAPATLDAALALDGTYCEQTRYAERWAYGDSRSDWFCRDCGGLIRDDPADGCELCGFGNPSVRDCELEV